jgi:cytoskeletal protein RodZ
MTIKFSSDSNNNSTPSLGSYLQKYRKAQNYLLEGVAQETKIKKEHLQAIENDEIIDIVGASYARLLVLTYARFLNADIPEVTELFQKQLDNVRQKEIKTPSISGQDKKKVNGKKILISKRVFQILGVIVLIVVILLISHYLYEKGTVRRDKIFSENSLSIGNETHTNFNDADGHNLDKEENFTYKRENFLARYILNEDSPWCVVPEYIKHEQFKKFNRGTAREG